MLRDCNPLRVATHGDVTLALEHRPHGVSLLLHKSLEQAARSHLQLLLAFPSPDDAPVFKRVGYRPIGDLVRYVRPLRYRTPFGERTPGMLAWAAGTLADLYGRSRDIVLAAGAPRLQGEWTDQVDPRMQRLWETSTKPDGIVGVRDAAYLRWRFDASPDGGFQYLLVVDPHDDSLLAWFVVRAMGGALHVHDYWSLHGPAIGTRYLDTLLHCARKAGHAAVSLDLASLSPYLSPWRATGFAERGRRPVVGHWQPAALGEHIGEVHLTAADVED